MVYIGNLWESLSYLSFWVIVGDPKLLDIKGDDREPARWGFAGMFANGIISGSAPVGSL